MYKRQAFLQMTGSYRSYERLKNNIQMCIRDRDKQHKKYYEFYTGEKWGKPENYDLCINSANYGIKETIDVIKRLLNQQTQ